MQLLLSLIYPQTCIQLGLKSNTRIYKNNLQNWLNINLLNWNIKIQTSSSLATQIKTQSKLVTRDRNNQNQR